MFNKTKGGKMKNLEITEEEKNIMLEALNRMWLHLHRDYEKCNKTINDKKIVTELERKLKQI